MSNRNRTLKETLTTSTFWQNIKLRTYPSIILYNMFTFDRTCYVSKPRVEILLCLVQRKMVKVHDLTASAASSECQRILVAYFLVLFVSRKSVSAR